MKNGYWELNLMDGKNPTHTGGFLTAYDQREFSPEEVAARESGQNAMDAGKKVSGVTQLVFQKLIAKGRNKSRFLDLIKANELLEPRVEVFSNGERNKHFATSVQKFLNADEVHALLIRDFNTCGLGGDWQKYDKGDHFARLVCALNLDDKADNDASSGGSFGLGKTTYAKSSDINTVIYHSVFAPDQRSNNVSRRLMVSGVYPKHILDGQTYGGFAYFGASLDNQDHVAAPFEDKEAKNFWDEVADIFQSDISRSEEQTGTDILIIMDSIDLKKLKRAVEDYYFPALISNELSVRFIDEKNDTDHPTVNSREDLDQFVKLYKKVKGKANISEETLRVGPFNKRHNKNIGRYAFEAAEPDEAKSQRNNCVAIMRGTGMVINYIKTGGDQYEPAVGVYFADQDIHKYLQTAENAAHSEWSEHSARLRQKFPDDGGKIVSHVNNVIKKRFVEFQRDLQPDVTNSRSESGLLARLLSSSLSGGTKGNSGIPKSFPNPVSISLNQKNRSNNKSVWTLKIRDCDFTPEAPFSLTLLPSISLAGDSKKVAIKHMEFLVKDLNGVTLHNDSTPKIVESFRKGDGLDYIIEIANPGRHNYVVQCKFIAENGVFDAK